MLKRSEEEDGLAERRDSSYRVQAIVEAALYEAAECGWSSVSMDRIARRVGITKGGLYHHFPSREALRERCCRHLESMSLRLLEVCERKGSAREGLRAFIEGHLEEWDYRSFQLAALTPETCNRHAETLVPRLAELIERAVAQGEIRRVDGMNHATALVLMLDAAASYIAAETMPAGDAAAVVKAGLLGVIECSKYG